MNVFKHYLGQLPERLQAVLTEFMTGKIVVEQSDIINLGKDQTEIKALTELVYSVNIQNMLETTLVDIRLPSKAIDQYLETLPKTPEGFLVNADALNEFIGKRFPNIAVSENKAAIIPHEQAANEEQRIALHTSAKIALGIK